MLHTIVARFTVLAINLVQRLWIVMAAWCRELVNARKIFAAISTAQKNQAVVWLEMIKVK